MCMNLQFQKYEYFGFNHNYQLGIFLLDGDKNFESLGWKSKKCN